GDVDGAHLPRLALRLTFAVVADELDARDRGRLEGEADRAADQAGANYADTVAFRGHFRHSVKSLARAAPREKRSAEDVLVDAGEQPREDVDDGTHDLEQDAELAAGHERQGAQGGQE